jgi:hypothetical protein
MMDKEARDVNRVLIDSDSHCRLFSRYLTSLKISTICLVLIIVLSHIEIIVQNKRAVNNQQIFWIAFALVILPYALYCIAQLKLIADFTKGARKSANQSS